MILELLAIVLVSIGAGIALRGIVIAGLGDIVLGSVMAVCGAWYLLSTGVISL